MDQPKLKFETAKTVIYHMYYKLVLRSFYAHKYWNYDTEIMIIIEILDT